MLPEIQIEPPHLRSHWFAISGALIQIPAVSILAEATIKFVRASTAIFKATGIGDPSQLSAAIGDAIVTISVGMLFALIGTILLLIAIFPMRYRSPWLFRLLIILGVLYLPALPIGTIIGIIFLVIVLTKRREFRRAIPRTES